MVAVSVFPDLHGFVDRIVLGRARRRGAERGIIIMSCTSSRRRWFRSSLDLAKKARLQLMRLEDRVVPTNSLEISMLDAIGYVNKTVAVTLKHEGSGTPAGYLDWGDGTATVSLSTWLYAVQDKILTHSYSSANTFTVTATDPNISKTDTQDVVIRADVPPVFAVDAQANMEWSAYATSSGNNPKNTSVGMVRYADGVVDVHFPDLESSGFGMPFGITRSWSNGPGYDKGTELGFGWNINQLPTVVQANGENTLSIVIDGNQARTFDLTTTANVYRERFFGQHQLTHDTTNHRYILTTPTGVVYKFADFQSHWASAAQGTFDSRTDPNGNVISVYARETTGQISEIRRDNGGTVYESWLFDYSVDKTKITKVTLRRGPNTSSYTNYRRVEYAHYGSGEDFGNEGDLKTAKIYNGSDTIPISTQYFRYFKPGEIGGFSGAIRMYVGFASYERADAALDPLTAANSSLDDYADLAFTYDTSRRIVSQQVQGMGCSMCSAGVGTYTFSYSESATGAPDGVNHWETKTTETLPDNNQNIIYTNAYGQVMQFVQKDGSNYWRTHYVYDGLGKLTQKSNPSATTNVNESYPTLVITNGARLGIETEFLANATTTGSQYGASLARDWDGDYVVSWSSANGDDTSGGVYAQRFNAVGQPQGSEFRVNTTTTGLQNYSVVAMDEDGDFVIVWQSYGQDGSSYGIYGQRFNSSGQTQGSEFRVNTSTTNLQMAPSVAMDGDGNFAVTWHSYQGPNYDVYAQRYNSSGTAQGSEFRVNTTTSNTQWTPSIAMDNDGDFVVVWHSYGQAGDNNAVFGQRFNSSGVAQGSEFRVNTSTTGSQWDPAIAMDESGDFVVAWSSLVGGDQDVWAQRYNASGVAQGSEFRANSSTGNWQYLTALACNAAGDFFIAWTDDVLDLSFQGVFGQFYMADGTATGQFKINDYTTNSQTSCAVASDYDGNFVIAWDGPGTGDSTGVFTRQLERRNTYISDSTGYIERYHYGRVTTAGSDTTTGTGSAGDIAGFLKSTWIVQGEIDGGGNDLIKQNALTYYLHSDGTNTVSPLATSTVYRNTDATGGQTTTMGYSFAASSLEMTAATVTHPIVTTGQNGPNSAAIEFMQLDRYGRGTYMIDAESHLTYREFDDATGAVTYQITDVDTDDATPEIEDVVEDLDAAVAWYVPNKSGLHLTTESDVDFMGRVTLDIDGNGNETYVIYNDPNHEVRIYPDWDSSLFSKSGGPTGPTQVYREDWDASYTESLTMSAQPNVSSGVPIGTESISSLQSLSRTNLNNAGQAISQDAYFYLTGLSYSTSAGIGTINVNYYRSLTDYADRGGVKRTETPTGTITRYVRDNLNRVSSVWIGTDDTPTTGYWSPSNNSGANMVKVNEATYDSGGVGDGNMTKMVSDPGAAADRETDYFYDWRNRLVAVKSGVESVESLTLDTQRPISYNVYDNLNHVTEAYTYDGDNLTISVSGGLVSAPSSSARRSKRTTDFDERGRVYASHVFSVDQSNGTVSSDSLNTNTWYDARGQQIKISQPGGLVTKFAYDGVGRLLTTYQSDGGSDSGYSDADDVTSDTVYEETWTQYDSNGNPVKTTVKQRFHDASGTGALQDRSNQPKARISYSGNYYDRADRLVAQVNEGTNGGSTWTWSSTIPTRSATELLYTVTYDSAGRRYQTVDPRNIESRTYYDALGRTTETIENYVNGTVSDTDDKKTDFAYDGMSHLTSYKAWLNSTDYEETGYQYGVTTGGGSDINSNDLLLKEKFPDKSSGDPSSSSSDQTSYKYNAFGQRIEMTDRNGNVHAYLYDVVGRPSADAVTTLGSGVDGTVRRLETAYDTAGRAYLFTSYDKSSSGSVVNQVQRTFNGLGQMTAEYQEQTGSVNVSTSPKIQYTFSEMVESKAYVNHSRLISIAYPTVSKVDNRTLTYNYDSVGRLTSIGDGTVTLEGFDYLGLNTVVDRTHPESGVDLTYLTSGKTTSDSQDQYTGFDRFGRIVDQKWTKSGTNKDRIVYTYDEDGNRLTRDVTMSGSGSSDNFDEIYTYDKLNQLSAVDRGVMSGGKINSPITGQSWNPDALGNFESVTNTVYGTSTITENRTHNRQNQLLTLTITGSSTTTLSYDNAGSMNQSVFAEQGKSAVTTTFSYDAWNRMMSLNGSGRYGYDALNRRLKEDTKTFIYSNNWQVLEERTSGTVTFRYAWSPVYKDGMIARDEYAADINGDFHVSERLYAATDANYNVTALINTSGGVDERFAYDPYGSVKLLDNAWATAGSSANGWVYLHQDGRMDIATGMYHFRNREVDAELMRWNRVDPIAFSGRDNNLYRFDNNNPSVHIDPNGLACAQQTQTPIPFILEPITNWPLPGFPSIQIGGSSLTDPPSIQLVPSNPTTPGGWLGSLIAAGFSIPNLKHPTAKYQGAGWGCQIKSPIMFTPGGIKTDADWNIEFWLGLYTRAPPAVP